VPDLYEGEALQVVARVDRLQGAVAISGLRPQPWTRQLKLSGASALPAPGIGRLWARARIDTLEDALRRGEDEAAVRGQIVETALRHGLVSRFTSLVAVDKTPARPKDEAMGSTRVMNATPEGSLQFAQGSMGWLRELLLALAMALASLLLLRGRA
jgi:Ca-activated chloride channel family protein